MCSVVSSSHWQNLHLASSINPITFRYLFILECPLSRSTTALTAVTYQVYRGFWSSIRWGGTKNIAWRPDSLLFYFAFLHVQSTHQRPRGICQRKIGYVFAQPHNFSQKWYRTDNGIVQARSLKNGNKIHKKATYC